MSGPAILKLSAWGARILQDKNYQFTLFVNWLNDIATDAAEKMLKELKQEQGKKAVSKKSPLGKFGSRIEYWKWDQMGGCIENPTAKLGPSIDEF